MKVSRSGAAACLLFAASMVSAQTTTTGGVAGVITDPSGAVISGATITLTNVATGAVQDARSGSSGAYRFDLLPPGSYKISVEQTGFDRLESTLVVDSSKVVAANLKLVIGGASQTVEVSTVAQLINADDANVATTISQAQVAEVPNSGNNLLFETRISPALTPASASWAARCTSWMARTSTIHTTTQTTPVRPISHSA